MTHSSPNEPLDLDKVIFTDVVTPRTILNRELKDSQCIKTLRELKPGSFVVVNHAYGSLHLYYDQVQDILALWRLRGQL